MVLDEYTREGLTIHCARSITAEDVVQVLQRLFAHRGAPVYIKSDNSPEFTSADTYGTGCLVCDYAGTNWKIRHLWRDKRDQ